MTVADLEQYFRALANILSASGGSAARDLADAADRLVPFGSLRMDAFAQFLGAAWEYKTTGVLSVPEAKAKPARKSPTKTPTLSPRTPDELLAKVRALHERILDPSVSREHVESEIRAFGGLTKPQLDGVASGCGFGRKFKNKGEVLEALIDFVMRRRASFERADA